MAAAIHYIGCIPQRDQKFNNVPSGIPSWDGNLGFCENLSKMPVEEQLVGCLDNILAIAYYLTFNGRACHELINEFIDEFLADVKGRLTTVATRTFPNGPYAKMLKTILALAKYCTSMRWDEDVDIGFVVDSLSNVAYRATPRVFISYNGKPMMHFVPFLIFMNRKTDVNYQDYVVADGYAIGPLGFSWYPINRNNDSGCYEVDVQFYPIGSVFHASETPLDKGASIPLLAYMSRFEPRKDVTFDTLIGMIGDTCMHLDIGRAGTTPSQVLAAVIYSRLFNIGNISSSYIGFDPFPGQRDRMRAFEQLVKFVAYMHQRYGVRAAGDKVLTKIFDCLATTKEQQTTVNFLRENGGGASAEQIRASSEVLGPALEALSFISQRPSLLSAQSQVTGPVAAETETSTTPSTPNQEPDAPKPEENTAKAEPGQAEDTQQSDATAEDDTNQDLGEDDTSADDSSSSGSPSTSSDNNDSSASASSGEDGKDTQPEDTPGKQEPEVDTSDVGGFEFKVADPESETIDSVMFREEMSSFLKNVLANPPDDLSPQNVATLTNLHRFWLHCLRIETIMGIVGNCLKRLPKSLIQLNTKLYGV